MIEQWFGAETKVALQDKDGNDVDLSIGVRAAHKSHGKVTTDIFVCDSDGEIYSDAVVLGDAKARKNLAEKVVAHTPAVDFDRLVAVLVEIAAKVAEQLSTDVGKKGRGNTSHREQQSLEAPDMVCVGVNYGGDHVYILRPPATQPDYAPSVTGLYHGEMVTHVPPANLSWTLPQVENVMVQYENAQQPGWAAQLLADLEKWHRGASDLGRDEAYLLLALYDMLTYIPEQTDYLPIILLEAEPERGKSRTGQAVVAVARHGLHLQGIREANLLRDASHLQATLFIDLMNVWDTARREKCEDVILGRWERGGTVQRVQYPDRGAFDDTVTYNIFGPTIIATNEPIHRILDTRCLRVDMPLSNRRFAGRIRTEDAKPLIEKLMAWRAVMMGQPLAECQPPVDGRLGDILRPLQQVLLTVAPERADEFNAIIEWQRGRRQNDLAQSTEAAIVGAVLACQSQARDGWLPLQIVLDEFNRDRSQCYSPKWLGGKVRGMGWETSRIGHDKITCLKWNVDLLTQLCERYDIVSQDSPAVA